MTSKHRIQYHVSRPVAYNHRKAPIIAVCPITIDLFLHPVMSLNVSPFAIAWTATAFGSARWRQTASIWNAVWRLKHVLRGLKRQEATSCNSLLWPERCKSRRLRLVAITFRQYSHYSLYDLRIYGVMTRCSCTILSRQTQNFGYNTAAVNNLIHRLIDRYANQHGLLLLSVPAISDKTVSGIRVTTGSTFCRYNVLCD